MQYSIDYSANRSTLKAQTNRKQIPLLARVNSPAAAVDSLSLAYKMYKIIYIISSLSVCTVYYYHWQWHIIFVDIFAPTLRVACSKAMSMTSFNVWVAFCAGKQHEQKSSVSCAFLLEMSTFPLLTFTQMCALARVLEFISNKRCWITCAHFRFTVSCCEHILTDSMLLKQNQTRK